jgi:hypothetical protein
LLTPIAAPSANRPTKENNEQKNRQPYELKLLSHDTSPHLIHFAEPLQPIQPLWFITLEPGIVMQKLPCDGKVWNGFGLTSKKNQTFTDLFRV